MARPIIFGEIPGIEEGYIFKNRQDMMFSSFHRYWGAGIDGSAADGASAIVLSGGYEDDRDYGNEIVYTGAGGNKNGKQVEDQIWENRGNAALRKSMDAGLPVRVIRSKGTKPSKVEYEYVGLYSVVRAWIEVGKNGYKICRFQLEYNGSNNKISEGNESNYDPKGTQRKEATILRIIRDTEMARKIKEQYNYECQVCGQTIETKSGRYAEGAHIKPLGNPHNGDDRADNLICLCPNHHVMFDKGLFSIDDDLTVIGALAGKLKTYPTHHLNKSNLQYHRQIHEHN